MVEDQTRLSLNSEQKCYFLPLSNFFPSGSMSFTSNISSNRIPAISDLCADVIRGPNLTSHAYCGASACRREPHRCIRSKRRALNGINDGMTVACMHDGGIWVRSWLHHYVWDSGKLIRTGPYNRRHNCFRGGARHTWAYPLPVPFSCGEEVLSRLKFVIPVWLIYILW